MDHEFQIYLAKWGVGVEEFERGALDQKAKLIKTFEARKSTEVNYKIADISKAVYELDALKFAKASFDQLPYQSVALPFVAVSTIYMRIIAPWRHERWPYTEAQARWRNGVGVRLTAPFYPTQRFFPLIAIAWALDRARVLIRES